MTAVSQISVHAQAILAAHWGISPEATLTLNNEASRLTRESSDAMSELICAGFVKAEKAANGFAQSMTYTLTSLGKKTNIRKSLTWMERHGKFSLTEPILHVSAASRDVLAERQRQISVEGWTAEHDDEARNGEMSRAAACYAMQAALDSIGTPSLTDATKHMIRELWPWSGKWWKPSNRRRDLVKAAALILAEIERIDRAEGQA